MALTVGEIQYTNILPLFFHINKEEMEKTGVRFFPQIPAELNRKMERGEVDLGGISSFSFGENSERYSLFPQLSVSTFGKVGSILLFSKKEITELDGASIALTSSSATSVALLKIILQEYYRVQPHYETVTPDFATMMEHHSACLLIGEDAIKARWDKAAESLYVYDLGELWYSFTNLPMTYAVMAVRNDCIQREMTQLQSLLTQMTASKRRTAEDHYREMIAEVVKSHGGDPFFWSNYFHGINYDLTEEHLKGLQHYFTLAHKHGLIDHVPTFTIFKYSLQGI
ncbi:hypothetical protein A374_03424 [Fictibacillus macauensis ZFHKF-1]|uniref:Chorismate dehydratase n=1 Tax=Fictibacillus macauensis ZFHKF-1 TaxID=1196324 RepID=I8ALT2_9BACL|nr:menaquinone biosynthesis protein [Fictibacillus macauensis]EIT86589.1 hypothetical protein A374_03424 [Fictibacillus macauensis ZFHKF-1]